MSVVVAVKDGNKIWIGADSQCSNSYSKKTLSNKNNFKIFKPKDDKNLVIGYCGTVRDMNIFSCVDSYIDELTKLKNEVNFKYMVNTVVPKLFKILNDNDRTIKDPKVLPNLESQLIFACKDKIFEIGSNGQVIECDDYCSIGSGSDFARGYLNKADFKNPKQDVINAIKSACTSDLYVGYPIVVMNTEDDSVEIIQK